MKRMQLWWMLCLLTVLACKKKPADVDNPPLTPEITSFAPEHGTPGTVVKITGKNFKTGYTVTFGGIDAAVTAATATELTVPVPAAAVTGKIKVHTATSATDFVVDAPGPAIIDFTPREGPFGTQVTLVGHGFGDAPKVTLNGIEAEVKQSSAAQIVITIPVNTGLSAHKIRVESGGGVLETASAFTVKEAGPFAKWESRQIANPAPGGIFQMGLGFSFKGKLYWGFTRMSFLQTAAEYFVFDPADPRKEWKLAPSPPADMAPAIMQNATAVVLDNQLYIGTGLTPTASKRWWRYDPETNAATGLTDYPENTSGALSFVLNNSIYVGFGGTHQTLYRFKAGNWEVAATGNFRELSSGNAVVLGGDAYFGRAIMTAGGPRKAMFKFTSPGQLVQVADMPDDVAMQSTPAFAVGNKGYFVVDKRVWEYTPGAGSWRAVIATADAPSIRYVGVINNVVFGWTGTGEVYEFKF
ncbi:hypothetical protein EGT74_21360 [Chitinophaga lutea]|uniref:IPT/TIG domain-containing protein n=1 Tax=Chitinophaga lutea TaxID=2488634 RepID=A0A3N4Q0R9_9BACT|nr:IPT/TIG domain-containing protein [Chitinophaga lutea]RPE09540.1 hypothetical protein EGT74_21360 [Chitinophaga lutea]